MGGKISAETLGRHLCCENANIAEPMDREQGFAGQRKTFDQYSELVVLPSLSQASVWLVGDCFGETMSIFIWK